MSAIGLGAILASTAANALGSGVSQNTGWSDSAENSFSDSGSYNIAAGNAWTDANTANIWAANEAQKNRDFQEYMSNTSYQRARKDLEAAGINPILAAHISGASTPAGSAAQTFMNSYSNSYSEGGSSSHSESTGYSKSGNESNSMPAYMKMINGAATILNAIPETYQKNYANARGYVGK